MDDISQDLLRWHRQQEAAGDIDMQGLGQVLEEPRGLKQLCSR